MRAVAVRMGSCAELTFGQTKEVHSKCEQREPNGDVDRDGAKHVESLVEW